MCITFADLFVVNGPSFYILLRGDASVVCWQHNGSLAGLPRFTNN